MDDNKSTHSVWLKKIKNFDYLLEDQDCDVCIVGAGISGLTIAYELLKVGLSVIVLDKERSIRGESSMTTAHLSNAIDERFYNLEKYHGKSGIKLTANSHYEAIKKIESIIQAEEIECDFSWVNGYLIPGQDDGAELLRKELKASKEAGINDVFFMEELSAIKSLNTSALCYPKQAQFDPLKYLAGLQDAILKLNGKIYGGCMVTDYDQDGSIQVKIKNGKKLSCKDLVFANPVPSHHTVMMHTKEASYRSYAIGIKIPSGSFPSCLLWDTEDPYHYVRINSGEKEDILIIGGEDHRVGQEMLHNNPFKNLKYWAKKRLGISGECLYKWSGQIIETIDGLAYIGKTPGKDHVFEASGFGGHGMTNGTIAGMIIPALILKYNNPWIKLYDPARKSISAIGTYIKENIQGASQNIDWILPSEHQKENEISKDEGSVLVIEGEKVAVYRDKQNNFNKKCATCPHMGALVRWNHIEKSWDCPFHGSRFDTNGHVLNGPAVSSLKQCEQDKQKIMKEEAEFEESEE